MKKPIMRISAILLTLTISLLLAAPPVFAQRTTTQTPVPPPTVQPTVQPAAPASQAPAELPVSRVSLFSSGVGYFEHSASVQGNAQFRLTFSTEQINDVLKSMVLRDLDGGSVNMVQFPSSEPLSRALKSFAIDIGSSGSLVALLQQVRGAELTVYTPTAVTGRLLSIETRRVPITLPTGGQQLADETLLNIIGADGIRSVVLSPGLSIKLHDARLNDELNRALTLILEANDPNRLPVDLSFAGYGQRRIRVAYINETPVWKTSYRLDLSDNRPFLQGWAIVENNSEFDWNNVSLSLVSGRPISFIQDLYTSLYNKRPVIQTTVEAAPLPQSYSEGIAPPSPPMAAKSAAPMPQEMMRAYSGAGADYAAEAMLSLADSGVAAATTAERAGELFAFTVSSPVNLPRRQSAMLPLYNGPLSAEKISLFSLGQGSQHPLNGARITNSSGLQLPAGPITVFDGGMYAGDALITTLLPDDKRLITYAVDQTMLIQTDQRESRTISTARIVGGVLTIERLAVYTQTYRIANKGRDDRVLIIEHPKNTARRLVKPVAFDEQTDSLYRFRLTVPKGASQDFVVEEQQTFAETITLINARNTAFLSYSSQGEIPAAVRNALIRAGDLHNAVTAINTRIAEMNREKSSLESGQARLRSNIETLGRTTPEGQRFLQRLMADEDRIEALTRSLATAAEELKKAQADLENYLKTLTVR